MAVEFYKSVVSYLGSNVLNANITLTGHSLGGGLAGFVGALYHKESVAFNNMPFELAVENAYQGANAVIPPLLWSNIKQDIYGAGPTWAPTLSLAKTIFTDGEVLEALRMLQTSPKTPLEAHSDLGMVGLHSQAVLVALNWAQVHEKTGWEAAGAYLWDNFSSLTVANAINGLADRSGPDGTPSDVLQKAIAYSSLDEGERPFGDTALASFFDDAVDLGTALDKSSVSSTLVASADALARAAVQFAGQLAIGDVQGGINASVAQGVLQLSESETTLAVDFGSSRWAYGADSSVIVARRELLDAVFATLSSAGNASDVAAGMRWLWNDTDRSIIDRIVYRVSNDAATLTLPSREGITGNVSVFVGGNGVDVVTGSADDEIIHGGLGDDRLTGGAGDDLLIGGIGADTLSADWAGTFLRAAQDWTRST